MKSRPSSILRHKVTRLGSAGPPAPIALRDPVLHMHQREPWNRAFSLASTALKEYEIIVAKWVRQLQVVGCMKYMIEKSDEKANAVVDMTKWLKYFRCALTAIGLISLRRQVITVQISWATWRSSPNRFSDGADADQGFLRFCGGFSSNPLLGTFTLEYSLYVVTWAVLCRFLHGALTIRCTSSRRHCTTEVPACTLTRILLRTGLRSAADGRKQERSIL